MDRRTFLLATAGLLPALSAGCRAHQYGHILGEAQPDLVGSHQAGAATWYPLVDESVAKLLGRAADGMPAPVGVDAQAVAYGGELPAAAPATVCFVALENKSSEELGDFKDQLYQRIDSQINACEPFGLVSRRMVDVALRETRLRPDSLFLPGNRDLFAATLGQQGTPVDYLLYATVTSGTTERNQSTQRDYLLTLEMVNVHTGQQIKESAEIRKGYHKTRAGRWWQYGPFKQADG